MGDMGDDFRAWRDDRRQYRDQHGRKCEGCITKLPKAHPSILLPGQKCRACGHVDPRYRADRGSER